MGKSFRKTPITGITTARSEKVDKRIANRKFRKHNNQALHTHRLDSLWNELDEAYNKWAMSKDGKQYMHNPPPKWMRK